MRQRLFSELGAVTAEFVIVLPTVIAVLGLAIGALGLQVDRLKLLQSAAEAARGLARGEQVRVGQVSQRGELVCVKLVQATRFGFDLAEELCVRREGQ